MMRKNIILPNILEIEGQTYSLEKKPIGSGGNANVYLCKNEITGEEYALKIQVNISNKMLKRFKREITFIQQLSHDNIIKCVESGFINCDFKEQQKLKMQISHL